MSAIKISAAALVACAFAKPSVKNLHIQHVKNLHTAAKSTWVPEQIKLTYGATCDVMKIYYATDNHTENTYVPSVQYGTSADKLTFTTTGSNDNYTIFNIRSPSLHFVNLTGLTCSNALYYYRVGNDASGWSPVLNFSTSFAAGDKTAYPVRYVAYADMGISNSANTAGFVTDLVSAGMVDHIIHAGDIAYADNRAHINNGSLYDGVLNDFYREVSPYSQLVPYMSSSGNHEILGTGPDSKDFYAYRKRMSPTLPWTESAGSEFWYSFNRGPVHYMAFDIDQAYSAGSAQHAFILADLAAVDRSVTPWVVAFSHFPMMCSNFFWCLPEADGPKAFREVYEPVWNAPATKVDIFISGHVHAAEVMYPQVAGVVTQSNFTDIQQTFHVMVGFPGDIEVCCNSWQKPKPAYSFWRDDDVASDGGFFGVSHWTIVNDTHFNLKMFNSGNQSAVLDQWVSRKFPF